MSREQVEAWLGSRRPAPPPALAGRMRQVVAAAPAHLAGKGGMAEVLGNLGLMLLNGVVRCEPQGSLVALDLLAADAFVTYAFEAASDEGGDVAGLSGRLLAAVAQ